MGKVYESPQMKSNPTRIEQSNNTIVSTFSDPSVIQSVTNRFNGDIKFDPELNIMAYTIR